MISNQQRHLTPLRVCDLLHATGGAIVCGGPLLTVIKAMQTVLVEADKKTAPKE